jgi:hypothetical protein
VPSVVSGLPRLGKCQPEVIDVDGSLQLVHDALRLRANQLSIRIQVRCFILSGAPPEAIRRLVEIGLKVKKRPQLPTRPSPTRTAN